MIVNHKQSAASPATELFRPSLALCVEKTRDNIRRLADDPRSAALATDGNYFGFPEGFFEIGNWTSSFFTGMALLAWRETEDEYFLNQALRLAPAYREKVYDRCLDTHHDLGFLYSLYSVALYKLTGDPVHREVALRAAELLAARFNEKGNFIRAWGRMDETESPIGNGSVRTDDMAIIDCLMNLPLLHWAARESGKARFHDVAVRHADMALNVFIRPDDSVYHAYRFDLQSGRPRVGDTFGGCTVDSCWARGQAWAIYGFALSYGYTRDPKYLDASLRLAKYFVSHLDDEVIPMWDFKLPSSASAIRDASAASIAICGLQELDRYDAADHGLARAKSALLKRLCAPAYLDSDLAVPGIQKHGQVGNGHPGGAQGAYTSWGDYFLMEALCRELSDAAVWW